MLTAHCERNQSRGFLASWGIVSEETASKEAQHPEGAFDARVAARFDFVSPRLMLMMTNAGRDRSLTCSRPSLTVAAK